MCLCQLRVREHVCVCVLRVCCMWANAHTMQKQKRNHVGVDVCAIIVGRKKVTDFFSGHQKANLRKSI